ncbi:hypothetical protein DMH04_17595 [Kibdelosporangium aridum]|uniref:Uncharacterized protein n=1 Tax=Kibdelosporangium aridum TaxID=2030 RepID=A0A428Y8C5_KIBAR|nr:hypothetical protein [Kibdelosporangium aridum]RSM63863.1 hypothetical protein DMH04_52305 [Kibdelosporangium aridum]RSM85123.1 hypothetical protein DMH04_17595 [Kibdelosporangium aridum]
MGTRRQRSARRLATLLSAAAGTWVIVRYDRAARGYRVVWTGGPTSQAMHALAERHAASIPELDLGELDWDRG